MGGEFTTVDFVPWEEFSKTGRNSLQTTELQIRAGQAGARREMWSICLKYVAKYVTIYRDKTQFTTVLM